MNLECTVLNTVFQKIARNHNMIVNIQNIIDASINGCEWGRKRGGDTLMFFHLPFC